MKWMALGLLFLSACNADGTLTAAPSAPLPEAPAQTGPSPTPLPSPSPTATAITCQYDDNVNDTHLTYRRTFAQSGDETVFCLADDGSIHQKTVTYAAGSPSLASAQCDPIGNGIWLFLCHPDGSPAAKKVLSTGGNLIINFQPNECSASYLY